MIPVFAAIDFSELLILVLLALALYSANRQRIGHGGDSGAYDNRW